MSCNFKDFEDYYLNKVLPNQKDVIESSFNGKLSPEDLLGNTLGTSIGSSLAILSHYHNWLLKNYNIKPKN